MPEFNELINKEITHYHEVGRKTFLFFKKTNSLSDLFAKAITLKSGNGFLLPICELHLSDDELIEELSKWREENNFAYPTQFRVTTDGTKTWLKAQVIDNENRMLFIVINKYGQRIGHVGLANAISSDQSIEADNIVRGEKNKNYGIMRDAMESLLDWVENNINPNQVYLRVFSDNENAIRFYKKIGFIEDILIPLEKVETEQKINFHVINAPSEKKPDKFFLKMIYKPECKWDGTKMILTAGPSISAREISYTLDAIKYGWNNEWNKYIKKFEATFATYLGVKYALTTSSCTGALHLALAALGIGPGDEVIVPDITWVATANAVLYVGATPIFADIEADSWCLDPKSFESLITDKTKAVMPVHLYGHPAKMDEIVSIARKHNLYIVEDAAPAIGALCFGQKTGTFGDYAAFSFQGAKVAVTGEGGMIVTNNDELYQRVYTIWDQGRVPGTFWIAHNGLKYKMSNVQAAIGLGQIERIDELVEAKRRIFRWYEEGLKGVPHIKLNKELTWARSIYWMTSILISKDAPLTRDEFRDKLKEKNIDTRSVFPAISQYPIWPKVQGPQPTASFVGEQALNLPSGVCLKHEQVAYICHCIKQIMNKES